MMDETSEQEIALVYQTQEWTYETLKQRVRDVLYWLNNDGGSSIYPGEVVIQMVPKGFEMMIGIMSLFYSKGVYCPFHPKDPIDRLEQIIKQTGSTRIFTVRSEVSASL